MKHRKTLISMFAALVVAGGFFGFWFFHKYELAKARSELQKNIELKMNQQIGKDHFKRMEKKDLDEQTTAYIPVLNNKEDTNYLKKEIKKVSKAELKKKDTLVFFTFDKKPLSNGVSNYQLKKENFGRDGRSYSARKIDQVGRQFAVDEKSGKLLKLRDILKNEPEALLQLKNAMQNHLMASKKIPLDKIGILGEAIYPSDLEDTNFQIDEENLILPVRIPGYREINQVVLPLSSLANQLNTRFLPAEAVPTVHKPIKGKKIALTFDDGPSSTTTPEILATLKKYNAKATFFVLGKEVLANPGIVKKEKEAGHQIANHSFNHPMLTKMSKQEVSEQILKTQMAVYREINEFPEMVRPPYGAINKEVSNQVAMPVAQWSVDTEDWKYRNEKHITNEVLKDAYDGAIILMHDIHPKTAKSLDGTLKKLKAEGYQFVTVNELLHSAPTIGNQYFDEDDKRLIN